MMFPREGIYHCTLGRDIKEGYTFFNLGTTYPTMRSPDVMIEPLAYLASQDEIGFIAVCREDKKWRSMISGSSWEEMLTRQGN